MALNRLIRFIFFAALMVEAQSALADSSSLKQALRYSDDFDLYEDEFVKASQSLINRRICSIADFAEVGGWAKATGPNKAKPVYFTYCGGYTISKRWYLNVSSGKIYK